MINYGYFRHRFDAHQNNKLNQLADEIGIIAYAYYYTILEIYGAKVSKNDNMNHATIHIRTIANVWRKRADSCKKVLTKLQLSGLLVVTFSKNTCTIEIPNYLKYYGSYKKTTPQKPPNKRKEKEIKEKESKVKERKGNNPHPIAIGTLEYLNNKTGRNLKPTHGNTKNASARISEGYTEQDFRDVIDYKCHEWLKDPKMKEYIRPQTLFNSEKFDGYLQVARERLQEIKQQEQENLEHEKSNRQLEAWRKAGKPAPGTPEYQEIINSVQ